MNIGIPKEQIESLIRNHRIESDDSKERVAIDFAVKLAQNSHSFNEKDFQALRTLGFDAEKIMEIIAMTGIAVFYNRFANATKINIDVGFTKILAGK